MEKICDGACLSCGLCVDICPRMAIKFQCDKNGFYYPVIDQEKCIDCGLCRKNCIVNNEVEGKQSQEAYKGYSTDEVLLLQSTSGGCVGELYRYFLNLGYAVCGVAYDEHWNCRFVLTYNWEDVDKFHGSKYIGADVSGIYQKVKDELSKGKGVFFVGTPCQCAGLKRYLGKQIENARIFICDLICWGVGSKYAFQKCLSEMSPDDPIVDYHMRSKCSGNSPYHECRSEIVTESGKRMTPSFYNEGFGYLFATGLVVKEECFQCQFASLKRHGDVTVGDWKNQLTEDEARNGCSLLLCNTNLGDTVIHELINDKKVTLFPLSFKMVVDTCTRLTKKMNMPAYREQRLVQMHEEPILAIAERHRKSLKVSLMQRVKKSIKKIVISLIK